MFIWGLTWLTNRLELYRQISNATTDTESFDNLHSIMYTMASSLTDFNSYFQDIEQFSFIHKFDLQHRFSISTLGESEQINSQSDIEIEQNNNSYNSSIYQSQPKVNSYSFRRKAPQVSNIYNKQQLNDSKRPSPVDSYQNSELPKQNQPIDNDDDEYSSVADSIQSTIPTQEKPVPMITLKVHWYLSSFLFLIKI